MGLANKICEMFKQNEDATCAVAAGNSSASTLGTTPTGGSDVSKKKWYHDISGKRILSKEEDVDPTRFQKGMK